MDHKVKMCRVRGGSVSPGRFWRRNLGSRSFSMNPELVFGKTILQALLDSWLD